MIGLVYTLPSPWASYLINGDASGLDGGERERIDAFLAANGLGSPMDCREIGFCRTCDAPGELAGDMSEFLFAEPEPEPEDPRAGLAGNVGEAEDHFNADGSAKP